MKHHLQGATARKMKLAVPLVRAEDGVKLVIYKPKQFEVVPEKPKCKWRLLWGENGIGCEAVKRKGNT